MHIPHPAQIKRPIPPTRTAPNPTAPANIPLPTIDPKFDSNRPAAPVLVAAAPLAPLVLAELVVCEPPDALAPPLAPAPLAPALAVPPAPALALALALDPAPLAPGRVYANLLHAAPLCTLPPLKASAI